MQLYSRDTVTIRRYKMSKYDIQITQEDYFCTITSFLRWKFCNKICKIDSGNISQCKFINQFYALPQLKREALIGMKLYTNGRITKLCEKLGVNAVLQHNRCYYENSGKVNLIFQQIATQVTREFLLPN